MGKRIGPRAQSKAFETLDGRGPVARLMKEIETALIEEMGGASLVSYQEKTVIRYCTIKALRAEMLWAEMLKKASQGEEIPEADDRRLNAFCNGIRADLQAIGLQRRARTVRDVDPLEWVKGEA